MGQLSNEEKKKQANKLQYVSRLSFNDYRTGCRNVRHTVNNSHIQNYAHPDDYAPQPHLLIKLLLGSYV